MTGSLAKCSVQDELADGKRSLRRCIISRMISLRWSMSLFARFLTFYIECERNRLQYISLYLDEPFALDRSRTVR